MLLRSVSQHFRLPAASFETAASGWYLNGALRNDLMHWNTEEHYETRVLNIHLMRDLW
jgi:hypothetical protein